MSNFNEDVAKVVLENAPQNEIYFTLCPKRYFTCLVKKGARCNS
jgi:hypothetical protein